MIRIRTEGHYAKIAFPYDAEAVAIIKGIPVHRWDKASKTWTTETSWVRLLATRMHARGFEIEINGEIFTPERPKAKAMSSSPFTALFSALPDRLKRPVFKALARVLHPDVAGADTTALMQQLNKEMDHR